MFCLLFPIQFSWCCSNQTCEKRMIFDCEYPLKNMYLHQPEYKLIFKHSKGKNLLEAISDTDFLTSVKHFISQSNHYHFLTSNESLKKDAVRKVTEKQLTVCLQLTCYIYYSEWKKLTEESLFVLWLRVSMNHLHLTEILP